jgi:outer membrane protein assembly factor BamE
MAQLLGPLHRGFRQAARKLHDHVHRLSTSIMRTRLLIILILSVGLMSGGCVYQAALSQGNLLDQEDIDLVETGMTRGQVRFLLGTPMIDDPFHDNRWDYVYFLRIGRKKASFKRWISIYFDGDKVTEIRKDQELSADL